MSRGRRKAEVTPATVRLNPHGVESNIFCSGSNLHQSRNSNLKLLPQRVLAAIFAFRAGQGARDAANTLSLLCPGRYVGV